MSKPVNTHIQTLPLPQVPEHPKKSSWRNSIIEVFSGGAGGAVGTIAIAPCMYFKMYMQEKARNPQTPPVFQRNPVKWFVGSPAMAMWMFPITAFQFYVNDVFQKRLSNDDERSLGAEEKLACSVGTGVLSAVFVGPQELVWSQQQKALADIENMKKEQKFSQEKMPKTGAAEVVKKILKEHGLKGIFRGLPETAAREAISTSVLTNLAAEYPILAPLVGATVSQPLDGRKTSKQMDFYYKASLREMFRSKAFSGLLVGRIPIYLVFMNTAPVVKDGMVKLLKKE